jgi:hypothetical protein
MKPLIELSIEHYEALLKYASQESPLYSRLTNAVKPQPDIVAVLCDLDEAEMLLQWQNIFVPTLSRKLRKRSEWLKFQHS